MPIWLARPALQVDGPPRTSWTCVTGIADATEATYTRLREYEAVDHVTCHRDNPVRARDARLCGLWAVGVAGTSASRSRRGTRSSVERRRAGRAMTADLSGMPASIVGALLGLICGAIAYGFQWTTHRTRSANSESGR